MTSDMTYSSVEEELARRGEVYTTTSGDSMKPLFRTHGCTVKLVAYRGGARRGDVILWRRHGKYLLHRVVRVTEEGYITRGDNRRRDDPPIREAEVYAVLDGYYRGEKWIPLTSRRYRLYVLLWGKPNPVRAVWLWARDTLKRMVGKPVV